MATRVVCPECNEKLVLRTPVGEHNQIKCSSCKAKFKPNSLRDTQPVNVATSDTAVDTPLVAPARTSRRERVERVSDPSFNVRDNGVIPSWFKVVGFVGLIVLATVGLLYSQNVPPVPTVVSAHESNAISDTSTPSVPSAVTVSTSRKEMLRPERLTGTWDLQESGGGTIEFGADGTVQIAAPLLTEKSLNLTSRWFVVGNDQDTFDLEIGNEPFRSANHQLRVVLIGDTTLRLIKYADSAAFSARERTFVKRK
jgi:hypothetical protein